MLEWMLLPLRRYADFNGRSRRKEFWMFALFVFAVYVVVAGLALTMAGGLGVDMMSGPAFILLMLFAVAIFIPSIAVQVRRFHDQEKSGWFVLLNFIPYLGGLIVLVFMCIEGTRGPNRYGPDPKSGEVAAA